MTVPRLIEISEYWSVVPPLHEAFASFIGALGATRKASSSARSGSEPANDDEKLMTDLIAAGFQIPAGILD